RIPAPPHAVPRRPVVGEKGATPSPAMMGRDRSTGGGRRAWRNLRPLRGRVTGMNGGNVHGDERLTAASGAGYQATVPPTAARLHVVALNWRDLGNPLAGGAEVHLEEILRHLGRRGHRCTLISSRFPGA